MVFDLATEPKHETGHRPIGRASSLVLPPGDNSFSHLPTSVFRSRFREELHADDHAADVAAAGGHLVEGD